MSVLYTESSDDLLGMALDSASSVSSCLGGLGTGIARPCGSRQIGVSNYFLIFLY
jgi:hypothetical protein